MTKFKTTLLAMAVSAAAFSVQAAQVSLYNGGALPEPGFLVRRN